MAGRHANPGPAGRRGRRGVSPEDSYVTGILFATAASLSLVLVATHLPLYDTGSAIGWYVVRVQERITVDLITDPLPIDAMHGVPVTSYELDDEMQAERGFALDDQEEVPPSVVGAASRPQSPERVQGRPVFDLVHMMPEIDGGLGAFYIHIEYPEAAMRAGIEGRLVLSFIVETDGTPSHIEVIQPLHALCDSAAVRALRQTRFVPGRQNGERVRVRMRLPVRFQLVEPGTAPVLRPLPTVRR